VADATEVVHTYEGCQFFACQTHLPAQALQTIPITWSFAIWGLDLAGPFKKAPGGYTHLLVAIDKFTKWIEAWPIATIKSEQAVQFFTNIIYRFGVPNSIITDNGTQFTGKPFLELWHPSPKMTRGHALRTGSYTVLLPEQPVPHHNSSSHTLHPNLNEFNSFQDYNRFSNNTAEVLRLHKEFNVNT